MKRTSGPRKTANLSESVHHQLNMYALAASAAGVGLLALAQPAQAKIVYTSANIRIGPNQHHNLDLNHDGRNDFMLEDMFVGSGSCDSTAYFKERAAPGNGVLLFHSGFVRALSQGARIGGEGNNFHPGTYLIGFYRRRMAGSGCDFSRGGDFLGAGSRYMGVAFTIKGKVHYGWARMNVSVHVTGHQHTIVTQLTGYAYETVPGKSIKAGQTKGTDNNDTIEQPTTTALSVPAPEPATLGALAMGAQGLSIWRRKEASLDGPPVVHRSTALGLRIPRTATIHC